MSSCCSLGVGRSLIGERYWDPDVFVGCQCSLALASIYVIGGSGFLVLVWSPTA
jgi:hypothetical protein